jgi:hypothetical protein
MTFENVNVLLKYRLGQWNITTLPVRPLDGYLHYITTLPVRPLDGYLHYPKLIN